jgi:hypothetical protein
VQRRPPSFPNGYRPTAGVIVSVAVGAGLFIGYLVMAIDRGLFRGERDPAQGRSWPGLGFVALVTIGLVGLACLIDAWRPRRRDRPGPSDAGDGPHSDRDGASPG